MTGMYFLFQCTHTNTHKLIHMYMDMDSQRSAYTLSMTAPCVSFRPPVMLILDLPTQRISCPFNGRRAGSTQHYSLFGIQLLINLRHVKTSEYLPRLNSNPPFSPSCHPFLSVSFSLFPSSGTNNLHFVSVSSYSLSPSLFNLSV